MKKMWVLIGSFILGAPTRAAADPVKAGSPPKVEESTPESDKAAAIAASSEADQWAASKKGDTPAMAQEAAEETPPPPAEASKAAPAEAPKPAPAEAPAPPPSEAAKPAPPSPPRVPHPGLNEMKGKLLSKSYDPNTIRVIVDGGFNVEFTYDAKTSIANGGSSISIDDLNYNDQVVVRYAGKELYAVEIDRVSKAPRPE
jgi:hypothetical protein